MALTLPLAQAAPVSRPRLIPNELLWPALALLGTLLLGLLILYLYDRWHKREFTRRNVTAPNEQLSHFRSLYERGQMSREEFERVKALLGGQIRQEMNVPAPTDAAAPPTDTNIQASPPGPQSPPPPEEPKS